MKSSISPIILIFVRVAPLVGAWIEILICLQACLRIYVAPLVGAWIEISSSCAEYTLSESLPSWERGLKYYYIFAKSNIFWSLPSWERGLKSTSVVCHNVIPEVAPLVGAWIEIEFKKTILTQDFKSLPSWERGLKSYVTKIRKCVGCRSPRGSVD